MTSFIALFVATALAQSIPDPNRACRGTPRVLSTECHKQFTWLNEGLGCKALPDTPVEYSKGLPFYMHYVVALRPPAEKGGTWKQDLNDGNEKEFRECLIKTYKGIHKLDVPDEVKRLAEKRIEGFFKSLNGKPGEREKLNLLNPFPAPEHSGLTDLPAPGRQR